MTLSKEELNALYGSLAVKDERPRCALTCDRCQKAPCTYRAGHDPFSGHYCPHCLTVVEGEESAIEEEDGHAWPY